MSRFKDRLSKQLIRLRLFFLRRIASCRKAVMILAPVFTQENIRDGYFRRIATVDGNVFSGCVRFYISGDCPELSDISISKRGRGLYAISFNGYEYDQMIRILALEKCCGNLYIHSAYRLFAGYVSDKMFSLFDNKDVKIFWDVHGAAPEECIMNGNPGISGRASECEEFLYRKANVIICVNEAMQAQLREKYGETKAEFVILPIIGNKASASRPANSADDLSVKPITVYSGGTQSWQNIPEMMQLIEDTADKYTFRLYMPDPEGLDAGYRKMLNDNAIVPVSLSPAELSKAYEECKYGLILRDDDVVNRVSCPTKLVEYLEHGILPVLKSDKLGDFTALGMKYLRVEDFRAGAVPDEAERAKIAEENMAVTDRIRELQRNGEARLRELINN